jgi:hypothetical protein
MRQRRVEDGIWGVSLASVGDWESAAIDKAIASHDANVLRLGVLGDEARCSLMACDD